MSADGANFNIPARSGLHPALSNRHEGAERQYCERGRHIGKACLADQRPESYSGIGKAGYQHSAAVDQDRDKAQCQKYCHYGNSRFGSSFEPSSSTPPINECTISGAASRCSQKAMSVRRVSRSGSAMSNRMAKPKTARPQARIRACAPRAAAAEKARNQSNDREPQRAAPRRNSYRYPKAPVVQCRQQHG